MKYSEMAKSCFESQKWKIPFGDYWIKLVMVINS